HLSQQNLTIDKVCFLGIDLLASQLKDEKHLDQPFTNCLDHLRELRVRECEVSLKMLCFVVNRIKKLERLQLLKVLFDKSLESKEITLRPKAFHFLAELNLSHSSGLEDRSFVKLFDEVQNLQVLNCMNTRMALFPNLI